MLEIFSAFCGLIQSILIMFNKKENWIFYMLNIITLTIFSFCAKLYGDVVENLIYVIFGLLGLLTWYSTFISKKIFGSENKIRYTNLKERCFYFFMFLMISIGMFFWLSHTDDPSPLLDAVTTGMGFTATLMMAFKRVDAWFYWLIDDILMAYIYYMLPDRGFWLMSLNIIWIFLAIGTWYTWHKEAKKNGFVNE
ncbi:MAG: nicotinamide mononucleotide transporter [Bacilli bacterium]|jgi:nicotinamide mononucleotide transporter PnuC|nr:nicotinamide mononucleotide transporter [Bacilli bacterium]